MIYCGTVNTEEIIAELDDGRYADVELIKSCERQSFVVRSNSCEDWMWEFWMDDPSVYEMARHAIINAVFECDDMDELIETLDEIFEEDFSEFVVDEEECDGDCDHCEYMN